MLKKICVEMNVMKIRCYTLKCRALHLRMQHYPLFCRFTVHPAEAAAVGVPESAGFGPEGGPGSQGGACTGDFTHCLAFPFTCHDVHIQLLVTR